MKKQSMEFFLTKLVEYVKDIFLMIGNYLYPSKVNSFMEQLQTSMVASAGGTDRDLAYPRFAKNCGYTIL